MKRMYLIIAMFILCAFAIILVACNLSYNAANIAVADEVVRIHIRANSNFDDDQQVKLLVRDAVTAYLEEVLEPCHDKNDALEALRQNSQKLSIIADSTLKKAGFTYKSTVCVKNEHFPVRDYNGYVFPEGDYDALIIYLGEGVGDNWWCVAFPPLCFVPDGKGEKVEYKSWVAEKLREIFG